MVVSVPQCNQEGIWPAEPASRPASRPAGQPACQWANLPRPLAELRPEQSVKGLTNRFARQPAKQPAERSDVRRADDVGHATSLRTSSMPCAVIRPSPVFRPCLCLSLLICPCPRVKASSGVPRPGARQVPSNQTSSASPDWEHEGGFACACLSQMGWRGIA